MEKPHDLQTVWANAERELAVLLSAAAARLDLEAVEKYSAAIRGVRALATGREPPSPNAASPRGDGPQAARSPSHRGDASAPPDERDRVAVVARGAISRPAKRTIAGKEYPRFHRERDGTLVKIGYSKSKRAKYEHRSPREVLDQLALALNKLGAGDRLFNTEELLDPQAGHLPEYPTYQTYLCLAFLVHGGLLTRFGRQGYRLSPDARADFPAAVGAAFDSLPTK